MKKPRKNPANQKSNRGEYLKLGLVIVGILLTSYFLHDYSGSVGGGEYMRWLMGVFMATFAIFKFMGYKEFVSIFASYDMLAGRYRLYGQLFPFIQMALALLYLLNVLPQLRDVLVAVVAALAAAGVSPDALAATSRRALCLLR